jgi:hypothetical protein
VHLSHIFAKLSITTRAELAAHAAAQDLTATNADELTHAPRRAAIRGRNQMNRLTP